MNACEAQAQLGLDQILAMSVLVFGLVLDEPLYHVVRSVYCRSFFPRLDERY